MSKEVKFKPSGAWVLLPNPMKKKTDSGIILDDATMAKMRTNELEVLAIGPEVRHIAVGTTVLVDPRVEALMIDLPEGEHVLIAEFQILGTL